MGFYFNVGLGAAKTRLQLQTSPERFATDHRLLEQIAHSWRWVAPR